VKLYESKVAPNPRRVRSCLAEQGIEVPIEPEQENLARWHAAASGRPSARA
jgi:glutathione S-transferase